MCERKYGVGITVGVFDLFHVGNLNLLERCKAIVLRGADKNPQTATQVITGIVPRNAG